MTQDWLNRDLTVMPRRWDDLGTVSYFHQSSFPGVDEDTKGALAVFRKLFARPNERGLVAIPMYLQNDTSRDQAERTERYLSYWLILGVLSDYEVTGMGRNTRYHVRLNDAVRTYLRDRDDANLDQHILGSLLNYQSRYRPTSISDISNSVKNFKGTKISEKSVGHLISFIYSEIEYQRREAIRTMVSFCTQTDSSPETLRTRIKAYFDSSEKFSQGLMEMEGAKPIYENVALLTQNVKGYDDAEHLYWETRRLLDERFRADWAAANFFAIAYRGRAATSGANLRLFDDILTTLHEDSGLDYKTTVTFLVGLLSDLTRLDAELKEELSLSLLCALATRLYKKFNLEYLTILDQKSLPKEHCEAMHLQVANIQLKEIVDAKYSRST